jgi:predicted ATPase
MLWKLKRLPGPTKDALQQLACLGNVVEIASLSLVFWESEETIHTSLLEAVGTGLILRLEAPMRSSTTAFRWRRMHSSPKTSVRGPPWDWSYAGERVRGPAHRACVRCCNQLNRGAALLVYRDEKALVATIDLQAGRRARASAAHASARAYFSAGMPLLDEGHWDSQHELTFSLWRERAQCEILSGNFEKAEQLILKLLQRGAPNVEFADASCLQVDLYVLKAEYPQAVDSTLTCLRRFGIDLPAHPTLEQVQAEHETVWQTLSERPIESLIDLPLMTDTELQAAMKALSALVVPAYHADFQLFCVLVCRMVKVSIQHGVRGPFGARLRHSRVYPRPGLSPLRFGVSLRQARL